MQGKGTVSVVRFLLLVVLLFASATYCHAVPPEPSAPQSQATATAPLEYVPPAWPEMPNAQGMLLRLGLCTALVLALCLATLWLLGRRFSHRISKKQTGGRLHVMATVPLANRCALHLLSIEKQRLIAAVDTAGLKALVLVPQDYESVLEEAVVEQSPGHWQI